MKKLLVALSLALVSGVFAADLAKDLLFEADYSTGKADPVVAKGSKKFTRYFDSPITIENGALVTGPKSASIRYSAVGNLNPTEGTIEMLVEPVDFKFGDGKAHPFFNVGNGTSNLGILSTKDEGPGANFTVSKSVYHPRCKAEEVDPDAKTYHLVAIYSEGYYAFYLDGEMIAERKAGNTAAPFDLKGAKGFLVGIGFNPWRNNGTTRTKFVRIYNRALEDTEILELAKKAGK